MKSTTTSEFAALNVRKTQTAPTVEINTRRQSGLFALAEKLEATGVELAAQHGLTILRICMGIVFVWFGALKLFPGVSPAEPLIRESISFLPMDLFLPFLAIWEMAIGVGFLTGKFMRVTLVLLFLQMGGAMSPLVLRPDLMWANFPHTWTLEGQYVFKDIILISVGLVYAATVRGGRLTSRK
jgi:uncharacterized membrane protein YphA (DoxX/SURF4 family)